MQKTIQRKKELLEVYICTCTETESEPEWSETEETPIEPHFNLDDVPFPKPIPEPVKPEIDYQALYEAQLLTTQLFQSTCHELEQQIARLKKQVQTRPTKKNYRQISHENQELTDFNQQLLAELTNLQTEIIQVQHQTVTEQQALRNQCDLTQNNLTTAQNSLTNLTNQRDIFRRRYQENQTKLNQTLENNQQLQNQIQQIISQAQH
jgi:hypothetical protein